ncbi:MAG: ornithine carbamoyltransferase [Phyllobacteriaceae bacterium]|nr:ornithine carbamoyltransferase [Phyllobacteriaceae bacterium]
MALPSHQRHFDDIASVSAGDLRAIMDRAKARKTAMKIHGQRPPVLEGKVLAMIFDKPSTRTRVSFDVGIRQLGGSSIILSGTETQLGRAETIGDTARVLSRYVDAIMFRANEHSRLMEMMDGASVPVINALTHDTHPCQIMADLMTYEEHRGSLEGAKIAWLGDGNNVLHSFLEAAPRFGFSVDAAVPQGREPQTRYVERATREGASVTIRTDPHAAARDADCIVTDAWVSMGHEETTPGHNVFAPYQVNAALMQMAKPGSLFMHCLPAHRGEEVTDEVMDGPQSVVFDEAENRLHAQKAILEWCLKGL